MKFLRSYSVVFSFALSTLAFGEATQSHHTGAKEGAIGFQDDKRPATQRILARNEHTAGRFSAMESLFPSNYSGPGFHFHIGLIQAMYVRSGSFFVDLLEDGRKREVLMEPGSFLSIALGVPHTFRNPFATEAVVLFIDAPGDLVPMFEAMANIDPNLPAEEKARQLKEIRKNSYDNHFITQNPVKTDL